jgi:hypothetical protein
MSTTSTFRLRSTAYDSIQPAIGTHLRGRCRSATPPTLARHQEFIQACRPEGLGYDAYKLNTITVVLRERRRYADVSQRARPRTGLTEVDRPASVQLTVTSTQPTSRQRK